MKKTIETGHRDGDKNEVRRKKDNSDITHLF